MAEHNDFGSKGEDLALNHLKEKGYQILETNWRSGHYEIDIIAQKDDLIVFVEVKSRSSTYLGEPEIFVNKKKQLFIIRAANAYLTRNKIDLNSRLDVISVVKSGEKFKLKHIERAFYPTL